MDFDINYELIENKNNKMLFSCFYKPRTNSLLKTVILSHGFMSNYQSLASLAVYLAEKGILAISFDFSGGSTYSRSEGNILDMSILTEVDDLVSVYEYVKKLDYVDSNNIFFLGESLGGVVSSFASYKLPSLKGEILLYPDFVIFDDLRDMYKDINNISNPYYLGYKVGLNFIRDTYYINYLDEIKKYNNDILIIHGKNDSIAPIEYSINVINTLNNKSELVTLDEAHGITKEENLELVCNKIFEYIKTRI